jgi:hypothetical protein
MSEEQPKKPQPQQPKSERATRRQAYNRTKRLEQEQAKKRTSE